MNPFIDIPLIGPLFGFFIVFLIPPLLVGGYALLLFTAINRIPRRSVRLLVAGAIAVILSLANYSYENFLRSALTTGQFISLGSSSFFITSFLGLTIMASGAIFAWHLMAVHLRTERPRLVFFAGFVISFLSAFLMGFAALFGPAVTGNITPGLTPQVTDTLFQMFRFSEMVLFGLVVLGLYRFLQELGQRTTAMQHNYLVYLAVPIIALFLFTPFFIGCCALSLTLLMSGIRSTIIRRIIVIAIPVTLILTGFWLSGMSGYHGPEYAGFIAFALLAFAVITPLFLFEPTFDRITVSGMWIIAGAIFTVTISEYFHNILPATSFPREVFPLLSLYVIAILVACTGQGVILRALGAYERREYGTGE
jgi:MFS family permease